MANKAFDAQVRRLQTAVMKHVACKLQEGGSLSFQNENHEVFIWFFEWEEDNQFGTDFGFSGFTHIVLQGTVLGWFKDEAALFRKVGTRDDLPNGVSMMVQPIPEEKKRVFVTTSRVFIFDQESLESLTDENFVAEVLDFTWVTFEVAEKLNSEFENLAYK